MPNSPRCLAWLLALLLVACGKPVSEKPNNSAKERNQQAARENKPPSRPDDPPANSNQQEPEEKAAPADPPAVEGKNHLQDAKSPYLLQHADNPVHWYPWGEAAFQKAKQENKPIFLSIGYSTCHWCHVMEHESFEDEEVAKLLNATFVCIKVDREERPDIDNLYMTVCQMLTGSGGWPLTIVMTPDKEPFFAGTYFPKSTRFGRLGMLQLIPRLEHVWKNNRDQIDQQTEAIVEALQGGSQLEPGDELSAEVLDLAYDQLVSTYDEAHGGFGGAPKFPTPHRLRFLLRYWKRSGQDEALKMVEQTLVKMRQGGVYDHLGYGFHRYSVDAQWLVPHFEKMLYDQAQLVLLYTEAYQATGQPFYRQVADEVLAYILRDMVSPEGGFYSAEDADSEGEEGKFYVWTAEEIEQVLGEEDAALAKTVWNIKPDGNFTDPATKEHPGTNILHYTAALDELAEQTGLKKEQLTKRIDALRQKLFAHREKRIHPLKDDKILTDWNGLMMAAVAKAGRAFDDDRYRQAARQAADFALEHLRTGEGRLWHRYRDGEAGIVGHLDDYAFLIYGLTEAYQTSFDVRYLQAAIDLQRQQNNHFWDAESGVYYLTADDAEELLYRQKESFDGATPSGNSVAMLNLVRLGRFGGKPEFEAMASTMSKAFSRTVRQAPMAHTQMLAAVDFAVGPSYEVVISGHSDAEDTQAMLAALWKPYVPNKIVLLRKGEQAMPDIVSVAPFTKTQLMLKDKATAYVCRRYQCDAPTNEIEKMLKSLEVGEAKEAQGTED